MSSAKNTSSNPFTPTFGSVPLTLAGRDVLVQDVLDGLNNIPGDPNRASIFVGPRGSGKTVLLTTIADRAQEIGWLAISVSSGENLLNEILVQLRDKGSHLLPAETLSHITELEVAGFAVARQVAPKKTTWRSEMTSLLRILNDQGVGLLITVDEISPYHEELRALVDVFQHFIRERYDVALMLAGLPSRVSQLIRDDDIGFLRRAFQHKVEKIPDSDVYYALKETIEHSGRTIDSKALEHAVEGIQGFAFLFQLVGYHLWRQSPDKTTISLDDVESGLRLAKRDMNRMIFEATCNELTPKELEYLLAMARSKSRGAVRTSEIATAMGVSIENAANIRAALVEKGVVQTPRRGFVEFEIPLLNDYLCETFDIIDI